MNEEQKKLMQAFIKILNTSASVYGVHISSVEDMYINVDGQVVARMYYDATEKCYVVTEREADHE